MQTAKQCLAKAVLQRYQPKTTYEFGQKTLPQRVGRIAYKLRHHKTASVAKAVIKEDDRAQALPERAEKASRFLCPVTRADRPAR